MKIASFSLIASCSLQLVLSFTPSPRNAVSSPPSTTSLNIVDPDAIHHLAQHGVDAARVLFLECDNNECSIVEGFKTSDGWHFENKLGGVYENHSPTHTSRILMMEMEDTE